MDRARSTGRLLNGTPGHLAIIALAGVLGFGVTRIGVVSLVEPTYEGVLEAVLTDTPDPVLGDAANDYPLTHALVLLSATVKGDDATASDMIERLRAAQMPTGWGLPWEFDAFGDGTVNPVSTAYANTTGMVLHALAEAGSSDESDRAVSEYWSTRLDLYSDQASDDVWVPSSAALIASAVARFGYSDEADEIFEQLRPFRFRWPYSELQPIANDLQNYVYILWSGEHAREQGVEVPWTTEAAVASLDRYGEVYPTDIDLNPDMEARSNSPWEVSGSGMALAFEAEHGTIGDWYDRTVEALREARFIPRYGAHALYGIAYWEMSPEESATPVSE